MVNTIGSWVTRLGASSLGERTAADHPGAVLYEVAPLDRGEVFAMAQTTTSRVPGGRHQQLGG